MAHQKRITEKMPIIEYRNGKPMRLYDGIEECCSIYHCHQELIKGLIYTGNPFPYSTDNITFDIAPSCGLHIENRKPDAKRTRYYSFDIVPDADSEKKKKTDRRLS